MKRIFALILSVLMISAALPIATFAGRFTDVQDNKWYSEAIEFCAVNGYMDGVAEGVFDRNGNVTRSMFVVILASIDKVDLAPYEGYTKFSDVAVGKWYTAAVNWAAEKNITAGIGDGVFGYKNPISREQMILLLFTYANYKGIDTSARADVSGFSDSGRIHAWAKDAIEWGAASGLISGIGDNLLDPRGYSTRAQVAVVIRAFVLNILSDCEHEWIAASCTEDGYCKKCNIKSAGALGHTTDNGICSRCGAEIFATAHDKLVYHIEDKGLVVDGKRAFSAVNTVDGAVFTTNVSHDVTDNSVRLSTEADDPANGSVNTIEVILPNSEGTRYTLTANIEGNVIKGEFDASLLDGYGDFTVTEYTGSEDDYALALVAANYLLAYTVKHSDDLIAANASMSLTDYGFAMNGFSIVK